MMSCTAEQILKDIRCITVDDDVDCRVHSDCALLTIVKQAATSLASIRPDLNSESKIIELQPGCYQDFTSPECTRVLDVRSESGDCYSPASFDAGKIDYVDSMFDDVCVDNSAFTPGKWKPDSTNPSAGWLSNEVPETGSYKAMVICSAPLGDIELDTELPGFICDEYYGIFMDLIMSKVYLIDHKDTFDQVRSDRYGDSYNEALRLKFLVDFSNEQPDWSIYRRKTNV